jgi:uncharacterized iron-regulated protein
VGAQAEETPLSRRSLLATSVGVAIAAAVPAVADREPDLFSQIYDAVTEKRISGHDLIRRLANADVVFVGEQHDDPLTHRAELRLLQDLHKSVGDRLTLSLEMFERDGQSPLEEYLASKIGEAELGKRVTLWSNYATDYRPLVEFAKAHRLPVIAANAPQRIVRQVGREGLAATVTGLSAADRALVAETVLAPEDDAYARRFASVIDAGHEDGKPMEPAKVRRFFEAQCVRDDTMAESIVRALAPGRIILHITGGFHVDAGAGTVQRVLWRKPISARVSVVKVVPYRGKIDSSPDHADANYLLYVPDTRPEEKKA